MQALAGVAEPCGKLLFNKGMDILSVRVNSKRSAVYIFPYFLQLSTYFFALLSADNTLPPKHCGMGYTALYVLPVHAAVKGDTGVEIVGPWVSFLFEAPFP